MKRFQVSISVQDFAAAIADYRFGIPPCVVKNGRYALWRIDILNFSISRKTDQPAGIIRHLGFEDDKEKAFREEKDSVGIAWEYFSQEQQQKEIDKIIP